MLRSCGRPGNGSLPITVYERPLGDGASVRIGFEPGYSPAGDEVEDQRLEEVTVHGASWASLPLVAYAEVLRDLAGLVPG